MTDVPGSPGARVVESGGEARRRELGRPSTIGRGGMESKIGAAELAAAGGDSGVDRVARRPAASCFAGRDAGTFFAAADRGEPAFKLWLRHGKRMVGAVRIDEGAARAITAGNASLLAVGVTASWARSGRRRSRGRRRRRPCDRPRHRRCRLGRPRRSPHGRRGRPPRPPGRPLDSRSAASARGMRSPCTESPSRCWPPPRARAERRSRARSPGTSSPHPHAATRCSETAAKLACRWRRPEGQSRCTRTRGERRRSEASARSSRAGPADDVGVRLATSPGNSAPPARRRSRSRHSDDEEHQRRGKQRPHAARFTT